MGYCVGGAQFVFLICNESTINPYSQNALVGQNGIKTKSQRQKGKKEGAKITQWNPCQRTIG